MDDKDLLLKNWFISAICDYFYITELPKETMGLRVLKVDSARHGKIVIYNNQLHVD